MPTYENNGRVSIFVPHTTSTFKIRCLFFNVDTFHFSIFFRCLKKGNKIFLYKQKAFYKCRLSFRRFNSIRHEISDCTFERRFMSTKETNKVIAFSISVQQLTTYRLRFCWFFKFILIYIFCYLQNNDGIQILDMTESELKMVEDHMGHHLNVHNNVYRQKSSMLEKRRRQGYKLPRKWTSNDK